jgi:S1-C subfamily serine protease
MRAVALLALLLVGCAQSVQVLPAPQVSPQEFYQGLVDTTVQVFVSCPDDRSGSGSGVVIHTNDKATYVATAAHVSKSATCLSKIGGVAYSVVAIDDETDIAILKGPPSDRRVTDSWVVPYRGMEVVAVGYPYQPFDAATGLQVTTGVLSAYVEGRYKFSAPIFFGNSGGPLFDRNGSLVGLTVSCIVGPGRVPMPGEYFATPASQVFRMLNEALQ